MTVDRFRSVEDVVHELRDRVARARFVARDWRAFGDVNENFVTIQFTFMCPCGSDLYERLSIPHPASVDFDSQVMGCVTSSVLRELEGHLRSES